MSPFIVDWDGRKIRTGIEPVLYLDRWEQFSRLTGPIRSQKILDERSFYDPGFTIGLAELGEEETLVDRIQFVLYLWYVSPEECRARADQAYQKLRSFTFAEMYKSVCEHVDVLSLGSIMNGAVI